MFNLRKFAQENNIQIPIINGTTIDVFHRTKTDEVVGNICETGFLAGAGAAHGVGIYANYTLYSAMQNYGLTSYGGIVVRGQINLQGFLIFDYDVAEKVYQENYRIFDQVKNIIGIDKFINDAKFLDQLNQDLTNAHQILKTKPKTTSSVLNKLRVTYRFDQKGLNGVLFTGHNDGNTVIAYNASLVVPKFHAFIDNRTKNSFNWKSCSSFATQALNSITEAGKNLDQQQWIKLNTQRNFFIRQLNQQIINKFINIDPQSYNQLPDTFMDDIIIGILAKHDDVKLSNYWKTRLQNHAPKKIAFIKLESEPLLFWKTFKQETKDIITKEDKRIVRDIWQNYINQNPTKWEEIPNDVKPALNNDKVIEYYSQLVNTNKKNIAFVPQEIRQQIQQITNVTNNTIQQVEQTIQDSNIIIEESKEFIIPVSSMGWLENEIKKINNKFARLGVPQVEIIVTEDDRKANTKHVKLKRQIPILKGGWELVAKIMPEKDENNQIINNIQKLGPRELPEEFFTKNLTCQHCNVNRQRNYYFVLFSREKRIYYCVGSACLNHFVGSTDVDADKIAKAAEIMQRTLEQFNQMIANKKHDPNKIRKSFKKDGIPLPFFLSRCIMIINKSGGYVSGGQAYKTRSTSTGKEAYFACINDALDNNYYSQLSSANVTWVNNTLDWLYTLDPNKVNDDYLYKLISFSSTGVVKKESANFMASALIAYQKQAKDKTINTQELLGNINDKIYFNGNITENIPLFFALSTGGKTDHNYYIAENQQQDRVAWTDNKNANFNVGDPISIHATITDHSEVDGKFTTILDQIQYITIEEYNQNSNQQQQKTNEFRQNNQQQQKKQYNQGDIVDDKFTITQIKQFRNTLYNVEDQFGTKLSFFLGRQLPEQVGDSIRVKGQIELKGQFINIINPEIVQNNGNQVQPLNQGTQYKGVVKITGEDSLHYAFNTTYLLVGIDQNGYRVAFNSNKFQNVKINDFVEISGKVGNSWNGRWTINYPKLLNIVDGYPNQNNPQND